MTTKTERELTLRDRLSHLTFDQARKLLGPRGAALLRQGGRYDIDPSEQVSVESDWLYVKLSDALVTMTLDDGARRRLRVRCSSCSPPCVHQAAALSLVLEEKLALGLSAPPVERTPAECLSDQELVDRALAERAERAKKEKMRLRSTDPSQLWTDYTVTNASSGKSYRVALRGWERGESYCSCPDFRKNTLGTCKHILHGLDKVARRFSAAERRRPYRRRHVSVHLRYGKELELRVGLPPRMASELQPVVEPLRGRPVTDLADLLRRVGKLEAAGQEVVIYPDAEEYIQRRLFQRRIDATVAEIRRDPAEHPLRRSLLRAELLPYQLDGIAFAVGAGRAVLADDMGLGKTIQGIGVAELLAREAGIRRVLVIAPTSLKSQWQSEIERFSERSCQLVLGKAAERARQYDGGAFFTVCNYEQVLRDILAIEQVRWDLIVLDEGQRIKNWEAKTSRIIKGLRSRFALVLSGTPLENRLDELFSVVEFIDERRLGPAFRFFHRHRLVDDKGKVLGYKNLATLRQTLAPVLLRRTRAAVLQQLPERSTEVIRITPTEEQLELHGAHMRVVSSIVRKAYLTEMDLLRLRKALLMCRLAANGTALVDKQDPGYSSKLEQLDDLVGQLGAEQRRKVVLFSEWTSMLDRIEPLLQRHELAYVRLDGSVPQKKRQGLVRQFLDDPEVRFFITTNAGSTGLNLQAANTVVNVDLPWNPAVLEQRISRVHRMGQARPVQVFILISVDTIEENLLATLSAKHDLAQAALDADSEVDSVELLSGMEELRRRLEVLLGAKPEAPVDESEKARIEREAAALERRQRVQAAAGQLLTAAFSLIGELVPPRADEQTERAARLIEQSLNDCLHQDEQGRWQLTVTLPKGAVRAGEDPGATEGAAASSGHDAEDTPHGLAPPNASGPLAALASSLAQLVKVSGTQ